MSLGYRIRVWLGSLVWYVKSRPQDTRAFSAPRVLPDGPLVNRVEPAAAGTTPPPAVADETGAVRSSERAAAPLTRHTRNWTPCPPSWCPICDDRRDAQWNYVEDGL